MALKEDAYQQEHEKVSLFDPISGCGQKIDKSSGRSDTLNK